MSSYNLWDLYQQGHQYFSQGEFHRSIECFEEVAVRARAQGNYELELAALSILPTSWSNLASYQKVIEAATRLLARARHLSNEREQMNAGLTLAVALSEIDLRGRWREIKPILLEGLAIARKWRENFSEVYHLTLLGWFAARVGQLEQGFVTLQEALNAIGSDIAKKSQFYLRGRIYRALSLLMRRRGAYIEAVRYAEMAIDVYRTEGELWYIPFAQLDLAHSERGCGELTEALQLDEIVLSQSQHWKLLGVEQGAEYLRSELLRELGYSDRAEKSALRALHLAQQMKLKEEEVKALLSLGCALLTLKRLNEADETLRHARKLSQERNYEDHYHNAETLLQTLNLGETNV